jgi:hypothetical protein
MRTALAWLTRSRRWGRERVLALALAPLALVAVPAAAVRADDETAPAVEGPWVVGAEADTTIIMDDRGNVIMTGDAPEQVQRCVSAAGCSAFWDDGIGAALIIVPVDDAGAIDRTVDRAEGGQPP